MILEMAMVLVFKTNVQERELAHQLTQQLLSFFSECKITFDLEDCDKILRLEGPSIDPDKVVRELENNGILCEPLE